ncbi:MAG: hypothetical protein MN733_42365, partial [Nitrososphaera sp.]|nr:hypothetical protein [Nitrososphaera sp.]
AFLNTNGWTIVYVCVPNTPHVNVVPIPIASGSKQRYPDIVAFRGQITKLVEVEMKLNSNVAENIQIRFDEAVAALSDQHAWENWRQHIHRVTGLLLPHRFVPECDLVLCKPPGPKQSKLVAALQEASINVVVPDKSI